jgi:small GTP-binding protein
MGCFSSKGFQSNGKKKYGVVLIGLDGAGATTILYFLKLGKQMMTMPTLGCNTETVQYGDSELVIWDIGGLDKVRSLWSEFSKDAQGVIFVVDAYDRERIPQAKEALFNFLKTQKQSDRKVPLLVFANKQDKEGALSPAEIANELELHKLALQSYQVVPCSGKTGEGLSDGMNWLLSEFKKNVNAGDRK